MPPCALRLWRQTLPIGTAALSTEKIIPRGHSSSRRLHKRLALPDVTDRPAQGTANRTMMPATHPTSLVSTSSHLPRVVCVRMPMRGGASVPYRPQRPDPHPTFVSPICTLHNEPCWRARDGSKRRMHTNRSSSSHYSGGVAASCQHLPFCDVAPRQL